LLWTKDAMGRILRAKSLTAVVPLAMLHHLCALVCEWKLTHDRHLNAYYNVAFWLATEDGHRCI